MRVLSSPFLKPAPLIFERIAHPLLLPNSGSKLRSADRGIADPIRVSPLGLSMTPSGLAWLLVEPAGRPVETDHF